MLEPANLTATADFLSQYVQGSTPPKPNDRLELTAKGVSISFAGNKTIPWMSKVVKVMDARSTLPLVDGRSFIQSTEIKALIFDLQSETDITASGDLEIRFKIPFAQFPYSITSLGADLTIGFGEYPSCSVLKLPTGTPVDYLRQSVLYKIVDVFY